MVVDKLLASIAIHVEPFALCQLSSGWRLRLPGPKGVMVHFVLQGRGAIRGPRGSSASLAPNRFVVVPALAAHALEAGRAVEHELRIDALPEDQSFHRFVAGPDKPTLIVACGVLFARYAGSLGLFDHLHDPVAVDMSDTQQVAAAFRELLAEQSKPGMGSEIITAALMSQCLVHLFRHLCTDPQQRIPWLAALGDARLGRVIDRILDDPAANHTVESLAEAAGMSRSTFAEHFVSAFGRTPMSLVQAVRMERAVALSRGGALPIDRISHEVGYTSRSYFSRAFKKHVGVPPNRFRDEDALTPAMVAGRLRPEATSPVDAVT